MRFVGGFTAVSGLVLFAYILAAVIVGLVGFYVVGVLLVVGAVVIAVSQFKNVGFIAGLIALVAGLCLVVPIAISAIAAPEPVGLVSVFWEWVQSPEAVALEFPDGAIQVLLVASWMVSGLFLIPMAAEKLPQSKEKFQEIGGEYVLYSLYTAAWGLTTGWFIGAVLGLLTKTATGNCPGC